MHKNPMKFENEKRVSELDIVNSLKKAGLTDGQVVCDYGAGTGIVTVEAAQLTSETVYALDMDPAMIGLIEDKLAQQSLTNVTVVKVEADQLPIEDQSIDLFLLVTVMHEIKEVPTFIQEVKRVLKPEGKVMVVDFYKKETPMGPPVEGRMSAYQASRHFFREDIDMVEQVELGDNLYLLVLKNR